MSDFTELVDLASERVGGVVLAANDEFFAPKENLLLASKPVFIEDKYTDGGKWMDGWETRRRREPGHDWAIIRLGLPGIIRGVVVDTSHFKGNYPAQCSVEACAAEPSASLEALASTQWVEILPQTDLKGDTQNLLALRSPYRFTHVRLNIFPDGGVARFRVYGEVIPDWKQLASEKEIDLVAVENGGLVRAASDMFFGSRHNLILPGPARNMGDGWETKRRRGPGHDWAIIQLGTEGVVHRIEVDTSHFKGNFPESCSVEGCRAPDVPVEKLQGASWQEVLSRSKLKADTRHVFEHELRVSNPISHLRLNIFPDGGVARLRAFGQVTPEGRLRAGLCHWNALAEREAEAALLACCESKNWAQQVLKQRPFRSIDALRRAADESWWALGEKDWREAFAAHPRIGAKGSEKQAGAAREWSEKEQAGTHGASAAALAELREANRAYESRFGCIFIVCATGKTTEEMLALLRQRLQNEPDKELRVAAEEQRRIMQLRLEKMLHS
ncbi:MAG TPA: allantoicase [Candidatus Acidoferrales bacterium]|nr:allantoicase [Candidatus Acidoferrales bacterium]